MAKPATYLLRSTAEGVPYYLSNVSPNGCHVEFDRRIDHGWRFTEKERADLAQDHGHIRGRWVLLDREEKRRAAAQGTTGLEGGAA
jgi:hypothetical protein